MRKFGALEETETTDSGTGRSIRVSTTARLRFREMFPRYADERNVRLNARIAKIFSRAGNQIMHHFKLKSAEEGAVEYAEIRQGPVGDFFYISAIRNGYIDILTLQDDWRKPKSGKGVTKYPGSSAEPIADSGTDEISLANLESDMKKYANVQAMWPQIYTMLKNPPQGVNLGGFPAKLPPMNKIVLENAPNAENPSAVGFVTTEDADDDGKLDTIHLSSERFMQELERHGIGRGEITQLNQLPPDRLAGLLSAFVEVISHEMGHLSDYRHGDENPFPGGEGVADQAGRAAVQQISVATNKRVLNKDRRHVMSALEILANLANELDSLGETKAADEVTKMMVKKSRWPWKKKEEPFELEQPTMAERPEGMENPLSGTYQDVPEYPRKEVEIKPDTEAIKVTGPEVAPLEGMPAPAPAAPAGPRIVGELGSIQPPNDPYSYEYHPQREAFEVKSYSYKDPNSPPNERAERAVGAFITKDNKKAWNILARHAFSEQELTPAEGRVLLDESTGDPQRDWVEAQAQFRGWVNAGYFGTGFSKRLYDQKADSVFSDLLNAELSPERALDIAVKIRRVSEYPDVESTLEDKESLLRLAAELQGWAEKAATQPEPSPAEDFTLASTDSVDEMQKKASANVDALAALFSTPGSRGPFGRD